MRIAILAVLLVAVPLAAIAWQHARYLRIRREIVQDRQPLFHGSGVFHVVHYLTSKPGADAIEDVGKLRDEIEASGRAAMVYAGRAVLTALASEQVPESDWSAIALVQYPSREVYDEIAASGSFRAALDRFDATYSHGMRRSAALNLAIPVGLLGVRLRDLITRQPPRLPFTPAPPERLTNVPNRERLQRFDAMRPYGEDSVVVVNLLKQGTPEQRAADRKYGLAMMGLFAEGVHGPMHMGAAVTLEGDARFDHVAIVHYPGIDYFLAMARGTFFNDIVGGKQPGDTLAIPTVPILARLEQASSR